MRNLLKILLVLAAPLLLLSFFVDKSYSQNENPCVINTDSPTFDINGYPVNDCPQLWEDHTLDFKYSPNPNQYVQARDANDLVHGLRIDGTVSSIIVAFRNLEAGTYYVCGQRDQGRCLQSNMGQFQPDSDGNIFIEVCGGGIHKAGTWLKGRQVTDLTATTDGAGRLGTDNDCNSGDWFHEGEDYELTLFYKSDNTEHQLAANFFSKHSYPVVQVKPVGGTKFTGTTPIDVLLWGTRPGGPHENNYQIVLEGTNNDYKKEQCVGTNKQGTTNSPNNAASTQTVGTQSQGTQLENGKVIPGKVVQDHFLNGTGWEVKGGGPAGKKTFSRGDQGGVGRGSFVLKINEKTTDNRPLGIAEGCDGGHSYIYIYFRIDPKYDNGIEIFDVKYDPNNADWEDIYEEVLKRGDYKAPPPPCSNYNDAEGKCYSIETAIGTIATTPEGFIGSIFAFVLLLASFGAVLVIIYAGYVFMTSRGDKEKIQSARETITAAVVGLLFIILSIVILEILSVDILAIPGFER